MAGLTWPLSDDTAEEVLDDKLYRRAGTITQPHDLRAGARGETEYFPDSMAGP